MKTLKKIFVILTAIALSSCSATYMGITTGDASISSNNFKMVRLVTGTASVKSILGFGGMGKEALVLEAKKNLLQNNPLKEREALANVTVDFKNSFVLIVHKQKVTISADIVEFIEQTPNKPSTKTIDNKTIDNKPVEKKQNNNPSVEKKSFDSKPVDYTPEKITDTSHSIDSIPAPKIIKSDKAITPKTQETPTAPTVPSFEPTILYSAPAEIVTSSGERYKVEAGDYFIGTLNEKGNPENGKLYGKNGRPKHVILPRRNH